MGDIYECDTSSGSSSSSTQYGEFAIHQNLLLKSVKQLFQVTEKLIEDHRETVNLTTIDYKEHTWSATSLLCDKAFEITNSKTYVFAHSVLCLGGMKDDPIEACLEEQNLMVFGKSSFERSESHRWRAGGVRVEDIPRIHNVGHPRRDSKPVTEQQCEPEQFTDRIIFMSITTLYGENQEHRKM